MDKIQIKIDKENEFMLGPTKLLVNNREIRDFISARFEVAADALPTLFLEMVGTTDINAFGCAVIDPSPRNLQGACRIITEELKKHGDFYKAFIDSVQSVLREAPEDVEILSNELAEKIVRRIAGEE